MATTSPHISKAWAAGLHASASECPSKTVIRCALRGFAPGASFRLTLVPDLIESFVEGALPIDLNSSGSINFSLRVDWVEDRSLLGFK